jgi:hypothetical protein
LFAYTERGVPTRTCTVSFQDSAGLRHSATVSAASLYEAAVLALHQFRSSSFTEVAAGKGTKLSVSVAVEAESHEVTVGQIENWLNAAGKSPKEQALKSTLREILGG